MLSNILNISEAALIGLHCMVYIAQHQDQLATTKSIAESIGASDNHLAKVLQRLVKENLIVSIRGPKGGFHLSRKAEEISLLNIYEAIEGKLNYRHCHMNNDKCPFNKCIFGNLSNNINQEFLDYFKKKTLIDFI